ncbi:MULTISPECIES: flavin-containing monooxygenase [unclassified Conexibacter]|uniref:flavin-containing monooxygenase n=1 Tax=unclassified Conexibacter TaxID=2627773 RepID=UPI00351C2C3B
MTADLTSSTAVEQLDVLIVGAGVSGIGAAYYLQQSHPGKSYAIVEAREAIGGTWDLFRYPGIRSDSDLHTFGYAFKPWEGEKAIADGPSIRAYIEQTASENGIDRHIRFGRRVLKAEWSSSAARWTVELADVASGETTTVSTRWILGATGYYRYDEGFTPAFPGLDRFGGQLIHPQHWPEDLDYAGKRVVVIGSGATAVTLVPAMAEQAGHVTMLQRSPTYILPLPSEDKLANWLRGRLGTRRAYALARWKNILRQIALYRASQRFPKQVRKVIRSVNERQLRGSGHDVDVHFNPAYEPWDQRLCAVPDGDFYRALRNGSASVVTDRIETFTERGVRLASGRELEADIVVTATGLNLLAIGGIEIVVDGREVALNDTIAYKSLMLSGVPNFAFAVGYTNSSWTLKVDLVWEYVCRLMAHQDATGTDTAVATPADPAMATRPLLDFKAGYVLRSLDAFPRQGEQAPWRVVMSYLADVRQLRRSPVEDGTMRFTRGAVAPAAAEPVEAAASA